MRIPIKHLMSFCILASFSLTPAWGFQEGHVKDAVYKKNFQKLYSKVTKDPQVMKALDIMIGTSGEYSREAILGKNLSNRPMKIEFKNLGTIRRAYSSYDALGWKKGSQLYIYINQKHRSAPPEALASLLSHEALHQDGKNSINEETYAWTLEAAVWTELTKINPSLQNNYHPLVKRENTISKMFKKANYTSKYIRRTVINNPGYRGLPQISPGFESVKL